MTRTYPLRALALIGLALSLAACATARDPAECPPTRNWAAWVNAMPGPNAQPRLIVTAEAELAAGTRARLVPGPTDRRLPPGQRFTLTTERAFGAPGGWQQVRGEIAPALPNYGEVIVGCGGETVTRISPVERAV